MGYKPKTKGVTKANCEDYLLQLDWWRCDEGWRHRDLHWPWSTETAIRLQLEIDRLGGVDEALAEPVAPKRRS